ncbi:uncharacterized protein CLUP02_02634 [Colletotrichum lupini]|uniref:Uncharacterized protein n=1 Tax=Colletotrichum lupini TaxID=145971 RepID=A0A9Q8WBY8_9PEZI|nr:uncharacterized protein CLUP02_02634 [Colletotrichum lupini]UQC77167.1 hypothetical protein CLUP02_02634 [Colletotrichum lupini]
MQGKLDAAAPCKEPNKALDQDWTSPKPCSAPRNAKYGLWRTETENLESGRLQTLASEPPPPLRLAFGSVFLVNPPPADLSCDKVDVEGGMHKRRETPISKIEEADAASCLSRIPPFTNWKPNVYRLSIVESPASPRTSS